MDEFRASILVRRGNRWGSQPSVQRVAADEPWSYCLHQQDNYESSSAIMNFRLSTCAFIWLPIVGGYENVESDYSNKSVVSSEYLEMSDFSGYLYYESENGERDRFHFSRETRAGNGSTVQYPDEEFCTWGSSHFKEISKLLVDQRQQNFTRPTKVEYESGSSFNTSEVHWEIPFKEKDENDLVKFFEEMLPVEKVKPKVSPTLPTLKYLLVCYEPKHPELGPSVKNTRQPSHSTEQMTFKFSSQFSTGYWSRYRCLSEVEWDEKPTRSILKEMLLELLQDDIKDRGMILECHKLMINHYEKVMCDSSLLGLCRCSEMENISNQFCEFITQFDVLGEELKEVVDKSENFNRFGMKILKQLNSFGFKQNYHEDIEGDFDQYSRVCIAYHQTKILQDQKERNCMHLLMTKLLGVYSQLLKLGEKLVKIAQDHMIDLHTSSQTTSNRIRFYQVEYATQLEIIRNFENALTSRVLRKADRRRRHRRWELSTSNS